MTYKFNSGLGAVICDNCRKIIDHGLGYKEYEVTWGLSKIDLCAMCRITINKKRPCCPDCGFAPYFKTDAERLEYMQCVWCGCKFE